MANWFEESGDFGDLLDPRTSSMIARLAFAKINNFIWFCIII